MTSSFGDPLETLVTSRPSIPILPSNHYQSPITVRPCFIHLTSRSIAVLWSPFHCRSSMLRSCCAHCSSVLCHLQSRAAPTTTLYYDRLSITPFLGLEPIHRRSVKLSLAYCQLPTSRHRLPVTVTHICPCIYFWISSFISLSNLTVGAPLAGTPTPPTGVKDFLVTSEFSV